MTTIDLATKTSIPATFARDIAAAKRTSAKWGNGAYIASVHAEYAKIAGRVEFATFAAQLVAAQRAGLVELERADLVSAMDSKLLAASHIEAQYCGFSTGDFHFVK